MWSSLTLARDGWTTLVKEIITVVPSHHSPHGYQFPWIEFACFAVSVSSAFNCSMECHLTPNTFITITIFFLLLLLLFRNIFSLYLMFCLFVGRLDRYAEPARWETSFHSQLSGSLDQDGVSSGSTDENCWRGCFPPRWQFLWQRSPPPYPAVWQWKRILK